MISNTSNVFSRLEKFKQIRRRQAFAPIAKIRVLVSPLTVADDLALRSMVTSPDIYDRELSKLIFDHCDFPDLQSVPRYDDFIEALSHIDRKVLLWAIFDATYKTLGVQDLVCPKCKEKFKKEILSKNLITEDTIRQLWSKEVSFKDDFITYEYVVEEEECDLKKIVFTLSIPTIKRHLDILRILDSATIKDNMNKFQTLLSKTEELALITKKITLFFSDNEVHELNTIREVHKLIGDFLLLDNVALIVNAFNTEYNDFDPNFKDIIQCPACGHTFDFRVDMEVALFKSFLGG